ncbi:hypothetical protein GCM10011375_05160 [Hymenobacter qilianensis]|uniref:Uncharacterized protein n=2 Tax=Hymenobacter qilianensis TaxID=1385715 RepID=A0ACB5PMB1_9BACT|nr:hypothetical protein [Hymenobacter qilianensis]QNP53835.1 hypothetical protein H9L05_10060 [Hymenobacter qilianensis]GGF52634.1 hypothetical protein GCM10011375_05160 [Hymenobacter qilianensis]
MQVRLPRQLRYFVVLLTNPSAVRKDRRATSLYSVSSAKLSHWWLPFLLVSLLSGCSTDGREAASLPPPTGHFEGPITYQGTELRAMLDLREVKPGQLQGEVRLADRQNLSLPAQQITYQHPRLTVRWATGATSDFTINLTREGDFLKGKFTADSTAAEILMVRRGDAEPLPYLEQPLRVRSGGRMLPAIVLLPDDTLQVHPAVVLLQNAPQRMPLAMHILTDLLARRGVVVMLVAGRPAAAATGVSPDSLAADVLAAARALKRVAGVDTTQIGLVGSGSGATALAMATSRDDKENSLIKYVVALGAPGTSNAAKEAEEIDRKLRQQDASVADRRLVALARTQLEQYVRREGRGDTTKLHRNLRKIAPQPWAATTGLPTWVPGKDELTQPKWQELVFDPRAVWEQVRVPVLLLYGGADTTLNVQASANRLRGNAGRRRGSVVRVYAGADQQLLLPAGTQNGKWQWPRPVPGYVDDLTAWLRERLER